MAQIIPLQAKVSFQQEATKKGNFYPMCIWANPEFIERFENSLIVSKILLEPDTENSNIVDSTLHGLSNYKVHKKKTKKELPDEIEQHFALLPELNHSIEMWFEPFNNVPTDVLLFSFEEVQGIADALLLAMDKADEEQREIIIPFSESFNGFLSEWKENTERTGSEFARQEIVK